MHARQLVVVIRPDAVGEAAHLFGREVLPLLRRQAGFAGATMLADRESGSAQFVTFWETLADLVRLGESRFFDAQVAKLAALFAGTPEVRVLDVEVLASPDREAGPGMTGAEGDR